MSMMKEFKEFAMKGNVVDLAVGVIIGGAFGKIVSSLVSDVLMPPIGLALGGLDFSNLVIVLKEAVGATPAVTIKYGVFVNTAIDFIEVDSGNPVMPCRSHRGDWHYSDIIVKNL